MGDRIAQIILEKIKTPEIKELVSLGETDRGTGSYGSTGVGADTMNVKTMNYGQVLEMKLKDKNDAANGRTLVS